MIQEDPLSFLKGFNYIGNVKENMFDTILFGGPNLIGKCYKTAS